MASCILFHGPGARQAALLRSSEVGRLVAPPFGDEGLKVDAAREVVSLLLSPPLSTERGVVVVGPMDQANYKASDVLLKRIEEFPETMQPILWAHDLGGVSPTIRSRCLDEWAPVGEDVEEDDVLISDAWALIEATLGDNLHEVSRIFQRRKTQMVELLEAMADALSTDLDDPKRLTLWNRLRAVARWHNPFFLEVAAALVGRRDG